MPIVCPKNRCHYHELAIKTQEPEKSVFCEHSIKFNYLMDWNKLKILKTKAYYAKRLTSEAWLSNSHPHVVNRSVGNSLP